jgi:hypothetical protein
VLTVPEMEWVVDVVEHYLTEVNDIAWTCDFAE